MHSTIFPLHLRSSNGISTSDPKSDTICFLQGVDFVGYKKIRFWRFGNISSNHKFCWFGSPIPRVRYSQGPLSRGTAIPRVPHSQGPTVRAVFQGNTSGVEPPVQNLHPRKRFIACFGGVNFNPFNNQTDILIKINNKN